MRKNFFIRLAILIGMAILISACDLLGSDYETLWKKAFKDNIISSSTTITLTANTWTDGNISANGYKWFKFTATASTQYIHEHADFGLYVQMYDSSGAGVESSYSHGYKDHGYQNLTSGQVYYLSVSCNSGGTYRITFNASETAPLHPSNIATAIMLTANTWTDGNLSAYGEQWFKFTATASTQIHASLGTLRGVWVQVYDSSGNGVESFIHWYTPPYDSSNVHKSMSVTSGQVYYIKVTCYNNSEGGTYRIAFNTIPALPGTIVTTLTDNAWTDGNLSAYGEQWFKFTATASTQYIHASFGTLTNLIVQVYDSSSNEVGSLIYLYDNSTTYASLSVTTGQVYYIRVMHWADNSGTYRIAFNTIPALPGTIATTLTTNTWTDGNFSENSEQWFKFTATASTQYIHASFGTLTDLYVQVYDSTGSTVGSQTNLSISSSRYTSRSVTSGQVYYIRVTPISSSYSGTYQITFNTSSTPPS